MSISLLAKLEAHIDNVIKHIGQLIAWFTLVMVVIMTVIVVLRYGFDIGWIAMQESVVYMHAIVFMLGAAYTLNQDEHVRVDIFYQKFSAKKRAWVDLLGTLLILFPVCIFLFVYSLEYVMSSWNILEGSGEAGGIPGVFALKTLLLVMPILFALQGLATAIKQILTLAGAENTVQEDK